MSITFTCAGTTFNPQITLVPGASNTVNWSWSGGSTTGLNPLITLDGATSVTMTVSGSGGISHVLAINLGYGDDNDTTQGPPGKGVPTSYEYTPDSGQVVTGISFPESVLTGLVYFLAENTELASSLDFTGCSALEYVELYNSPVTGVTLDSSMTSFVRLDVEGCALTALDLSPVWAQIYDLRAARQDGSTPGELAITAGSGNMTNLYHECVRDNYNGVTGAPGASKLPAAYYRLIWNCGFTGTLNATANPAMLQISAIGNNYSTASLSGQFEDSDGALLDLSCNKLTSVDLTDCQGLGYIDLSNNLLDQDAIDSVLETVSGWEVSSPVTGQLPGYPGQYYLLLQQNYTPSEDALAYQVNLADVLGWYVLFDQGTTVSEAPYSGMDGVNWRPGGTGSPPSYFGLGLPSASSAGPAGGMVLGHEFSVTETGLYLTGYRWYIIDANQAADTNISFALWEVTGAGTGTLVSGSHKTVTGSLTAGTWKTPTITPVALTENTPYMVVVGFEGSSGSTASYFPLSPGEFTAESTYRNGITNGPLSFYSDPAGGNPDPYGNTQGAFSTGSYDPTASLPTENYESSLYWVDVVVNT